MPNYECDKCGACCSGELIVEAYDLDVLREPRLAEAALGPAAASFRELMADLDDDGDRCIVIACGTPCAFLSDGNECSIYPTRPNMCVGMAAGSEQCQAARQARELPPLEALADQKASE